MSMFRTAAVAALVGLGAVAAGSASAQSPRTVMGATCGATSATAVPDNATEPRSGRKFILQFPCDLKPNEKITLVLNIHGAGSSSSYQHRYFPAGDYAQKYRLVVATPTAKADMPGRTWQPANDDQFLQDLTTQLVSQFGRRNIRSFWLAGHSQGGATSARIVCSPFFRNKVDGFFSLSGGRQGGATQRHPLYNAPDVGAPVPASVPNQGPGPGAAAGAAAARPAAAAQPNPNGPATCDYSHIYTSGEWEIAQVPQASTIAEKFGCERQWRRLDVADAQPGYVWDPGRQNPTRIGWGRQPRPGVAQVYSYDNCRDGRVVTDVLRMDKGHTEGLEPHITEEIVKMMVQARGGKLQRG